MGELHRAFSVFLFNPGGEMLLQKRDSYKYHSPGLWTNSCCSHPYPGEKTGEAAHRRLEEELGMEASLEELFAFHYQATFENGLTENEYDHVFIGVTQDLPRINREEVEAYRFVSMEELREELLHRPREFTVWFRLILEQYGKRIAEAVQKRLP